MRTLLLPLLAACAAPGPARPALAVFPTPDLVVDGHLALPNDLPSALTPVPVERLAWRTGFSPVQTAVFRLDVVVDPTSLPGLDGPAFGGAVQVWDLTEGVEVGAFAEVDAWPDPEAPPPLLVRPLRPVPAGHEVAVVLTSRVRTEGGGALERPDWFAALADGHPAEGQEHLAAPVRTLLDALDEAGVDDVVLATGWPVGDGTAPLRAMVDDLPVPPSWRFYATDDADLGDLVPPHTWRQAQGYLTTRTWLVDDVTFDLGPDGVPTPQGDDEATLLVHLPASVKDAPDGSAPVWIFGHGIFSSPSRYLSDPDDPSHVLELADRAGAIVVATAWRGLTTGDFSVPVIVGSDFGRFPELTDKLAQGVANTAALVKLVREGGLLSDPVFAGKADPDTIRYYGISLGGIEGATLLALVPEVPHAVLHVGGGAWSTMLERSQNWTVFEDLLVENGLDDPRDRQVLYSLSQLFWDAADPTSYVEELRDRSALWQIALGDDQVPNLASWMVVRGAGAKLVRPTVDVVGLDAVDAPASGPAIAVFDPQEGNPDADNRPAPDTTSHDVPRRWEGTTRQTLRFLDAEDPGVVEPACGPDTLCTPAHPAP